MSEPKSLAEEMRDPDFRREFVASTVMTRLALQIRAQREQRGWSQEELADRMGTTQSVIARYEDPDYGKMTLATLVRLAAVFDVPLDARIVSWDEWYAAYNVIGAP